MGNWIGSREMAPAEVKKPQALLRKGGHTPLEPENSSWESSFDLKGKGRTETYNKKNV